MKVLRVLYENRCIILFFNVKISQTMPYDAISYNEFVNKTWNEDIERKFIRDVLSECRHKEYDIVLDIGCSGGQVTTLLASEINASHIYGVDVCEDVIAFAKQNNTNDSISYIVQDFGVEFDCLAAELKGLEGKVSMIYSDGVLDLIPLENLATNMYRLLGKGGEVRANLSFVCDPYMDLTAEEKTIHEKEFIKIPDPQICVNEMLDVFKSVGFDVISTKLFECNVSMKVNDFEQNLMPTIVSEYVDYFVVRDEESVKIRCEELERKLIDSNRHFRDETTGDEMVESDWICIKFRLRKGFEQNMFTNKDKLLGQNKPWICA